MDRLRFLVHGSVMKLLAQSPLPIACALACDLRGRWALVVPACCPSCTSAVELIVCLSWTVLLWCKLDALFAVVAWGVAWEGAGSKGTT